MTATRLGNAVPTLDERAESKTRDSQWKRQEQIELVNAKRPLLAHETPVCTHHNIYSH